MFGFCYNVSMDWSLLVLNAILYLYFRRKKKCIRVYEDGTDGEEGHMSDSQMGGDSHHDSDSMIGSPAYSSASEDLLSTPHKSRLSSVESPLVHSPLVHDSSRDASDMDRTLKAPADNFLHLAQSSPYTPMHPSDRYRPMERYASPTLRVPNVTGLSPKPSGLSRSFSIESLAKSSINSDTKEKDISDQHNQSFDYSLSPLSSPGDLTNNSPKFSISTFSEDMNKNFKPKKSGGLNNSFSISTLSVSAVTPSRVHCSW